ncbi:hypothetical protein AB1Y20_006832 [Prymnesium parvum]|uniref:CAAX prenyl protease 2/Lysostaphin resistance protein A-like domain-containing protein n=1 Tax=Prymnesium parvum TaxID=97485 RepID=A0AB34IZI2_PRYPA
MMALWLHLAATSSLLAPLPLPRPPAVSRARQLACVAAVPDGPAEPRRFSDRPLPQAAVCLAGYLAHVLVLSRRGLRLGRLDLGLDTLAGCGVLAAAAAHRVRRGRRGVPPWLSGDTAAEEAEACACLADEAPKQKLKLLATGALLLGAPLAFSFLQPAFDAALYVLAIALPLTEAGLLGTRLLVEQTLLYVLLCKLIQRRHPDFFGSKWVRWSLNGPWLLPVLGGYSASIALFNLVEPLNQHMLSHLAYAPEGLVAKLANPADKKLSSLLVASITPCIGAPIFEELQSRAFIMQALTAVMSLRKALVVSGVLFGAQHLQIGLLLPLSVTGFFWAVLYVNSQNLLVPILIHALWNARIFLGSYLGL